MSIGGLIKWLLALGVPRLAKDASGNTVLVGAARSYALRGSLDEHGIMLLGDSIMTISPAVATERLGYEMQEQPLLAEFWMNAFLKGKRFRRTYGYGRSGRRAWITVLTPGQANYNANDDVDLQLAACPAYDVLIGLGTNDLPDSEGRTSAQIIADITTIALKCKNAGRRVAIKSIIPRMAADAGWTTEVQQKALRVNHGIRNLCHTNGYGYIPAAEVLTDYSVLTAFVLPASPNFVTYDNVHPNNKGARKIGKKLAEYYSTLRVDSPNYSPLHFIDDSSADNSNIQLLDNPLFNGTTGWTLNAIAGIVTAVTNTVIASPDGIGNALQIDITTNAGGFLNLAYAFWDNAPAVVSGYLLPTAKVKISASGADTGAPTELLYVELRGEITGAGTDSRRSEIRSFGFGGGSGTNSKPIDEALDVELTPTNPLIVTGNETGLNAIYRVGMYFSAAGSARIVLYGCGMYNVSKSPYNDPVNWK